jgi:predicted TPR repeat methyltransferase
MLMVEAADFESRQASLRAFLQEKPKNGRVMAQLASLLTDQAKVLVPGTEHGDKLREEAISLSRRAIQVAPQKLFGYASLSFASLDYKERMEALEKAVVLSEEHLLSRIGFLVRLLIEPREEEGKQVQRKIGSASKEHPSKREIKAEESKLYQRIEDALEEAWSNETELTRAQREFLSKHEYRLGLFFRKMRPEEVQQPRARKHFERSQKHSTTKSEMSTFWLATMEDDAIITKCPADYIISLYSTFAERFDELLVEKLNYQTPTKLRQLLDTTVDTSTQKWKRAADLGCGTGLSGLAFRDIVERMTGVDLSKEMIEKALQRKCYDELVVGDVTSVLGQEVVYDLVFACDVFVYIGDLEGVFRGVQKCLSSGGLFCFSTEFMDESFHGERPYILQACARFAHKQTYLEKLSAATGFDIVRLEICPIRKNEGVNVTGMLIILRAS